MALATLSIDLVAKLAGFEQTLDKAGRIAQKNAAQIEKHFAGLTKAGRLAAGALGGVFAGLSVAGVGALIRGTVDGIDALNDLKDATGSTIENLSALEDIAERNGETLDTVASILVKFNQGLKDADGKNGVSLALKQIGLDAAALRKLDPAEALRVTAQALLTYADDGDRARLVQELFGKSVRESAPFLKDLAEQGRLNATVTTKQAEAAEKFNKQLFALQKNATDAGRAFVSELLPALDRMSTQLNDGLAAYDSFLQATLDIGLNVDPFATLNQNLTATVQKFASVKEEIDKVNARQREGGVLARMFADADRRDLETLKEQLRLLEAREKYLRSQQARQGGRTTGPLSRPGATDGPPLPGVGGLGDTKGESKFQKYLRQLEEARVKTLDLNNVERARYEIAAGNLGKLTKAQESQILSLAAALDVLERKSKTVATPLESFRASELAGTDATNGALSTDQLEEYNTARARFNALMAGTPSKELEETRTDMLLLADALDRGAITTEQYLEAVGDSLGLETFSDRYERLNQLLDATPSAKLEKTRADMLLLADALNHGAITAEQFTEAAQTMLDSLPEAKEEASEFAKQAQRNIQDALGGTIKDALDGDFDAIKDRW